MMHKKSKLRLILNGWKNYLFADSRIEQLAKKRAEICSECEHAVEGFYEKLMPDDTLKEMKGLLCSLCDCPLQTKCRSEHDECPVGLWKDVTRFDKQTDKAE